MVRQGVPAEGIHLTALREALTAPHLSTATRRRLVRREDAARLGARLGRILETDLALKSSPGADRVIMERLVMDLCATGR